MSAQVSRRKFLAASAAASVVSAANVAGANDAIQIALIGIGRRGMHLLDEAMSARGSHGVRVVAVCDAYAPRLARAASACGARAFRNWQEIVERRDVDAVMIAAPDHWHAPMTIAAMECGKDVYCEAPMARTRAEAAAINACAASTNRLVQIGVAGTSEKRFHVARRLVADGVIGTLRWSQARHNSAPAGRVSIPSEEAPISPHDLDWHAFDGDAKQRAFDGRRFVHWRHYWDYSNGTALEMLFDRLAELLVAVGSQAPRRVSAAGGVYSTDGRETPDSFVATFEYAGGHRIVLASSTATPSELPPILRGSKGTLCLERDAILLDREETSCRRDDRSGRTKFTVPDGESHFENWLRSMRSRRPCACSPELGCAAMAALDMALNAYRAGTAVTASGARQRQASNPSHPSAAARIRA
jgi:predicted dehydrogenase